MCLTDWADVKHEDQYEVIAVRYGDLATSRSDVFLNYSDYREPDGPEQLAYYFWIARNDVRTFLLDTGFSPAVGARRGRRTHIDPREAWEALGIADDASTTVVLSHAHYDHIGNAGHFSNARFVMADAEFDFWVRHPRDQHLTRQVIEPSELQVLSDLQAAGRLQLISDSEELAPGLELLICPGHTPGQIMVRVNTATGALLLAADAVHLDEELDRKMPFRHMCDIVAAADSYTLVEQLRADGHVSDVIAGHEPSLMERFAPHPALPEHAIVLGSRLVG